MQNEQQKAIFQKAKDDRHKLWVKEKNIIWLSLAAFVAGSIITILTQSLWIMFVGFIIFFVPCMHVSLIFLDIQAGGEGVITKKNLIQMGIVFVVMIIFNLYLIFFPK